MPTFRQQAEFLRRFGFVAVEHADTPAAEETAAADGEQGGASAPAPPARAASRKAPPAPAPAPAAAPVARSAPPTGAPRDAASQIDDGRIAGLAAIADEVAACTACGLCHSRTQTVPGKGNAFTELLFVGEGPGAEEDKTGEPFVGRAGQLLTDIIRAMKFTRDEVFIANVVKCRPPGNRVPEPDEMAKCLPYLERQIDLIKPRVIVTLGATATVGLLPDTAGVGITKLRGKWLDYRGIAVMPTFHPSYLLRNPAAKRPVWEDMQQVMAVFGRTPK